MQRFFQWRFAFSQVSSITFALLGAVSSLCLGAPSSHAFELTYRASIYEIDFSAADFSDAVVNYTAYTYGRTFPGESFSFEIAVKPFFQNYTFNLHRDLILTGGESRPNAALYEVFSLGYEGGYTWSYQTPVATAPFAGFGESWIQRSPTDDGGWALAFLGGGATTEIVVQASYDLVVSIVGDWSRLGRRGNQLTFVNLEAGYTILENFIYDEETDRTWFSATRADWDGSSPDFHFILNHPTPVQPVPEPATLLGTGLAMAGGLAGRRYAQSRR